MNLFSKLIRYGSIAAALFGVFMIVNVSQTQAERQMPPPGEPPVPPPHKPFKEAVAATGRERPAADETGRPGSPRRAAL
jgi:hypothetical protein